MTASAMVLVTPPAMSDHASAGAPFCAVQQPCLLAGESPINGAGEPAASGEAPSPSLRAVLITAAGQAGIDPNLMLAVSWWESGWRQSAVSSEGAVGLMQVMPRTAAVIGPQWLHRDADIFDPADNAQLGAALLADLLRKYDLRTALASYYQGEPAIQSGRYAWDTWRYADGILHLAAQFAAGWTPL